MALKGKPLSLEHREKISTAWKERGGIDSAHRAKMIAGLRDPARHEKRSAAHRDKLHTEETKAKMSRNNGKRRMMVERWRTEIERQKTQLDEQAEYFSSLGVTVIKTDRAGCLAAALEALAL